MPEKKEFILKEKTKLKRLLSILLTLVMVVGMLPATSMTALAATAISNVTVTGVTEPKAGSVPTTDGISLGENAEIIPEGTFWSIYNESSAEYIPHLIKQRVLWRAKNTDFM